MGSKIKITEKDKTLLLGFVLVAMLLGFYGLFYNSKLPEIKAREAILVEKEAEKTRIQTLISTQTKRSEVLEESKKLVSLSMLDLEAEYKVEDLEKKFLTLLANQNARIISANFSEPQLTAITMNTYQLPEFDFKLNEAFSNYNKMNGKSILAEEEIKKIAAENELRMAIATSSTYNLEVDYQTYLDIVDRIKTDYPGIVVSNTSYNFIDYIAVIELTSYSLGDLEGIENHSIIGGYLNYQIKRAGSEVERVDNNNHIKKKNK